MDRDPARPIEAVLWTLGYDLRTLDSTWEWLHQSVPESPERARAIGMAGLTGIAELGRFDLLAPTLAAFDRAIPALPGDARLPLWASFLRWAQVIQEGTPEDLTTAYGDLRAKSEEYPTFTLFGFTLAVAADAHAGPALIQEARSAYEYVVSATADLQFENDALQTERLRRMGDWRSAPYNLSGTQALIGDMHLRAGDLEAARDAYYTAIHANAGYRWPFRQLLQTRLENAESLMESFLVNDPNAPRLGAGWIHSQPAEPLIPGFEGRIGNGTCTLCHTRLREADRIGGLEPVIGWARLRYDTPPEIRNPFPVFVALPDPDPEATPVGFSIGQSDLDQWSRQVDSDTYEVLLPVEPGSWFIAGQLFGGELGEHSALRFETYTSKRFFGLPRFVDIRAGHVTDLTSTPLRFTRSADEDGPR